MAVLQANALTLADHAKRLDPDGKTPAIVELLSQTNEILDDMRFAQGNLPTGTRTTVRTGLPSVFWRLLNQGVQPSKSLTAQIDEQCGMLEAWSEVDVEVCKLNGNEKSFRLSEAQAFLEAMNQEFSSTLFYGNQGVDPEEFNGFSVRYSTGVAANAANTQNVINAGGGGSDNSSIWLIVWGDQTCHGLFPKGSTAGLTHKDLGEVTVQDSNGIAGNRLRAYQDYFTWKVGLNLKDWRYVVRICNIDISELVGKTGSAADLSDLMIKAIHRIPNLNMGKACFYANRSVIQMLDIQRRDEMLGGPALTYKEIDGKYIPHFRGIPIKKCDALTETEAAVPFV
jgi:hypothetical protein